MASRRSAGWRGSIKTNAAPHLTTASIATTRSADRGRQIATVTSVPASSRFASLFARVSSSAYVRLCRWSVTAVACGVLATCSSNRSATFMASHPVHPLAQAQRPHVGPNLLDVREARLAGPFGAFATPTGGQVTSGRPNRVLLLVVEHDTKRHSKLLLVSAVLAEQVEVEGHAADPAARLDEFADRRDHHVESPRFELPADAGGAVGHHDGLADHDRVDAERHRLFDADHERIFDDV